MDKLKFFPGNAKEGDEDAIDESLEAHGQYKSLVVNRRTMSVLVGNNTLRRLRASGAKLARVEYVDVSEEEEIAINLVDNATARAGRLNERPLAKLLALARKSPGGLLGTG